MSMASVLDLAGKTTTAAAGSARSSSGAIDDDQSPLLSRRQWIELAWGAFTAASLVALAQPAA